MSTIASFDCNSCIAMTFAHQQTRNDFLRLPIDILETIVFYAIHDEKDLSAGRNAVIFGKVCVWTHAFTHCFSPLYHLLNRCLQKSQKKWEVGIMSYEIRMLPHTAIYVDGFGRQFDIKEFYSDDGLMDFIDKSKTHS